jgi:dTDP-4-dehydrorhamnose reductase
MKALVTGAQGMLGTDLCRVLADEHQVIGVDLRDFYVTAEAATREAMCAACPELIVHSAWLYGSHGKNFVRSISAPPTYARALARAIAEHVIPGRLLPGMHHLVDSGVCSWVELAQEALRAPGSSTRVQPIPAAEWSSPAGRPASSALRSRWMELQGLAPLRDWREAVRSYVKGIA